MKIGMKQVERDYAAMMKSFASPVEPNHVNCYKCPAGHITKTIDVDRGVTPFMHRCETCGEMANSSFYVDNVPLQQPTQEWYRPTLDKIKKMARKADTWEYQHVIQGGLCNRKIIT